MFSSILGQLCDQRYPTRAPDHVRQLYFDQGRGQVLPPVDRILSAFSKEAALLQTMYVVIDALDEHDRQAERHDLFSLLEKLLAGSSGNPSRLRLLITSRSEPYLKEGVDRMSHISFQLAGDGVRQDIDLFIQRQLANDSRLKKLPEDAKAAIERSLRAGAHGM